MIAMLFFILIAVLFGSVVLAEIVREGATHIQLRRGILAWLTGGNWSAKVGSILLIVGMGSLLRYSFEHSHVAPVWKLSGGIATSVILFVAARVVRTRWGRRAIPMALVGAAFGVAYLTAYSAFAFFHYVDGVVGGLLLAFTATCAGAYSVWRQSLSVAVLAMVGAFLAPAFALDQPGPGIVYSYYLAASVLSFAMIAVRGWRPLIHLSFLFTLAGGLFFAWTREFYTPAHYSVMQPLLLALVSVHVAMPIAERRAVVTEWVGRFDLAYFIALPITAAILLAFIASGYREQSTGLMFLACIWMIASVVLRLMAREEAERHLMVGALILAAAIVLHARDLHWALFGLAASVAMLALIYRLAWSNLARDLTTAATVLFAALHWEIVFHLLPQGAPFANQVVVERIAGGLLLIVAGRLIRRMQSAFWGVIEGAGILWLLVTITLELIRLHIASLPEIVHATFILGALCLSVIARWRPIPRRVVVFFSLVMFASTLWAAQKTSARLDIAFLVLTPLAYGALGLRKPIALSVAEAGDRFLSLAGVPVIAWLWAQQIDGIASATAMQFELGMAVAGVLGVIAVSAALRAHTHTWTQPLFAAYAVGMGIILAWFAIFQIQRGVWPVALELECVVGLCTLAFIEKDNEQSKKLLIACVIAVGLVIQSTLLRLLGPQGTLTALDVMRLQWPAIISLYWSVIGAALTIVAVRIASRMLWSVGAFVLVGCALKLILLDFGSLGQLANILALIAVGLVFLLVSWLAPFPPKKVASAPRTPVAPPPRESVIRSTRSKSGPPSHHLKSDATALHEERHAAFERQHSDQSHQRSEPTSVRTKALPSPEISTRGGWITLLVALVFAIWWIGSHLGSLIFRPSHSTVRTQQSSSQTRVEQAERAAELGITREQLVAQEQAESAKREDESAAQTVASPNTVTECSYFAAQLPKDYIVYAAGAYSGKKLDDALATTVDASGHAATAFDVTVNIPNQNVVLALGAYEPSTWSVHFTNNTHVVGVWASGYYDQKLLGVTNDIPVLYTSYAHDGGCGYFSITREQGASAQAKIIQLLGRQPLSMTFTTDGTIAIGDPVSNPHQSPPSAAANFGSVRDDSVPYPGMRGLEQLIAEGKMRPATYRDLKDWIARTGKELPISVSEQISSADVTGSLRPRTFVVLRPMQIPAGLYGASLAIFIVPPGVPKPTDNRGHSYILD